MDANLGVHVVISRRQNNDLWTFIRQVIVFDAAKPTLSQESFRRIKRRRFKCMSRRKQRINPVCTVCTEDFRCERSEPFLKVLKCGHAFHAECLRPWLCEHAATCPVCRASLSDLDFDEKRQTGGAVPSAAAETPM